MWRLALAAVLSGALGQVQASKTLAPAQPLQPRGEQLRGMMRSMMSNDDDNDAYAGDDSDGMSMYLRESANSLSKSLGPRWNGEKLEADAKSSREALFNSIASPKAVDAITGMMNALQ